MVFGRKRQKTYAKKQTNRARRVQHLQSTRYKKQSISKSIACSCGKAIMGFDACCSEDHLEVLLGHLHRQLVCGQTGQQLLRSHRPQVQLSSIRVCHLRGKSRRETTMENRSINLGTANAPSIPLPVQQDICKLHDDPLVNQCFRRSKCVRVRAKTTPPRGFIKGIKKWTATVGVDRERNALYPFRKSCIPR